VQKFSGQVQRRVGRITSDETRQRLKNYYINSTKCKCKCYWKAQGEGDAAAAASAVAHAVVIAAKLKEKERREGTKWGSS